MTSLSILVTADRDPVVLSVFLLRIQEFFLSRRLQGQLIVVDALAAYSEPPAAWESVSSLGQIQCDWLPMRAPGDQVLAIMHGLRHVSSHPVVIMDSDMADNIHDIERFLARHADGCEMVFAWRIERQGVSLPRRLLTRLFNQVVRTLTGLPLHDFNAPMLLLSERARLAIHEAAKSGPSARLQVCHLLKERLGEVEIRVREFPGKKSSYSWRALVVVGMRRLREVLLYALMRNGSR